MEKSSRKKKNHVFRRKCFPVSLILDLYPKAEVTGGVYKKHIKHQNASSSLNRTLECSCCFPPSPFTIPANIQAVPVLMAEWLLDCSASQVTDTREQTPELALVLLCRRLTNSKC